MKIDLIVDLQYGSTGKGLLAGYLANTNDYEAAVVCNMPNAGHTFIDKYGNKFVHKVLPNALASPDCDVAFIGPGAVFSEERLFEEIRDLRYAGYAVADIYIHESAVVLRPEHATWEAENLSHISSTMQGSAAAMKGKIDRNLASDNSAKAWRSKLEKRGVVAGTNVEVLQQEWYRGKILSQRNILAEGCQGFSLGYNQGFWPYCTSRECTTFRMLSDMGIPAMGDVTVWGSARTYPIRVGSLKDSTSGGCYGDQKELSWEELGQIPETTTVTGRERRVFSFSVHQFVDAFTENGVNKLFLNFANYMNPSQLGELVDRMDVEPDLYGYGPTVDDVKGKK